MAKIYKSINLDSSGGGSSTPPYGQSFSIATWSSSGSVYEIDILEATHEQGANVIVQVFELVSGVYREVELDIIASPAGNVTIEVSLSPDLRFAGKIVIKGE